MKMKLLFFLIFYQEDNLALKSNSERQPFPESISKNPYDEKK